MEFTTACRHVIGVAEIGLLMKISILTPSYNSGKYIERAIKSVLNQNYKDWEHIIADGGSTDNTIDILKQYPYLKWVSEQDRGQSDAMNKAFKLSDGDIIIYLNADDEFKPNVFGLIAKTFSNNKNCDILVGNLLQIYEDKKQLNIPRTSLKAILPFWKFRFPLNPLSYPYRRCVQEQIGEFPMENHCSMDYWFLLRAFQRFNVVKTDVVFGKYYFHGANKSLELDNSQQSLKYEMKNFICGNISLITTKIVFKYVFYIFIKLIEYLRNSFRKN